VSPVRHADTYHRRVPLRVLIAEDNYLLREGIERLLRATADVEVVGACATYDELIEGARSTRPDVVLTDIRMPPTNTDEGIRAALALRAEHPRIGVVVLSQHASPAYALALLAGDRSHRRRPLSPAFSACFTTTVVGFKHAEKWRGRPVRARRPARAGGRAGAT
jgi:CheY-like chemotaxis protein